MRVLFVSKPVVPPFHDGTKCLVRDVATRVTHVDPLVLATPSAPALQGARGAVETVPVYARSGGFTPALAQNFRAFWWVLVKSRADLWHFVFAPNPRTSQAGRFMRGLRHVPVVQTIASPPRDFTDIDALLFGDRIVAQSRWTRDQVARAYAGKGKEHPRVHVIPPPVPLGLERSTERALRVRAEFGIPRNAPLFVYPGDLEVSSGARVTKEIARHVASRVPGAITVFAYRRKTPRADVVAAELRAELDPACTRVLGSIPDVLELIASATAVLFPVDDLFGKVDVPIVLLESMVLGVPVVAFAGGPLLDLEFATLIPSLEPGPWLDAIAQLANDAGARRAVAERQSAGVRERHGADTIARAYEDLYLGLASSKGRPGGAEGASASKSGER